MYISIIQQELCVHMYTRKVSGEVEMKSEKKSETWTCNSLCARLWLSQVHT